MKAISFFLIILALVSCRTNKDDGMQVVGTEKTDHSKGSIFSLTSRWNTEEGEQIQLVDLRGKTMVVVMIYTSCKVACPQLVADIKKLEGKLEEQQQGEVQFVLVSIDPENDTPERLKEFALINDMDGEQWTFLQGTEEDVREFANVLAVKYDEIAPMDFSHSNIISVFDRKGEMINQQEGLGVDNSQTLAAIKQSVSEK